MTTTTTRTKRKQTYEAPALGSATKRMMRALVRRAQEGDTEALEQLLALEAGFLSEMIAEAGRGLRRQGYSLAQLSKVTGTSRAACSKRFDLPADEVSTRNVA